jgi:regulator of protease activity HflC (stomatin/prohibitin superfamily)
MTESGLFTFILWQLFLLLPGCHGLFQLCSLLSGYVGVKVYLLGSAKGDIEVVGTGRQWLGINEDLFLFPLFKQTYSFTQSKIEGSTTDESFTFQTAEGLSVNADIGVALRIDRTKVKEIFQTYRKGIDEIIHEFLRNEIRSALNSAASKYKVEYVYGEGKNKLLIEATSAVQAKMVLQGIIVEDLFALGDFRLPQVVVATLNAKIAATQAAEKSENELRQAKAEAQKRIAEAEGESASKKTLAEGEAKANQIKLSTITEQLIKYESIMNERKAIEKWNGVSPTTVMGGNVIPFVHTQVANK